MNKLLVMTPDGRRQLVEVGEGGGYFDDSLVLHDERKDGPLKGAQPPEVPAGMAAKVASVSKGVVRWELEELPANPAPTKADLLAEIEALKMRVEALDK